MGIIIQFPKREQKQPQLNNFAFRDYEPDFSRCCNGASYNAVCVKCGKCGRIFVNGVLKKKGD